jgi:hypothetical protein
MHSGTTAQAAKPDIRYVMPSLRTTCPYKVLSCLGKKKPTKT